MIYGRLFLLSIIHLLRWRNRKASKVAGFVSSIYEAHKAWWESRKSYIIKAKPTRPWDFSTATFPSWRYCTSDVFVVLQSSCVAVALYLLTHFTGRVCCQVDGGHSRLHARLQRQTSSWKQAEPLIMTASEQIFTQWTLPDSSAGIDQPGWISFFPPSDQASGSIFPLLVKLLQPLQRPTSITHT